MPAAIMDKVPDNVPPELVVDFDMYAPPGFDPGDPHGAWKIFQDNNPDIVWTPHYGGHWIVNRAEDIDFVQMNPDRFSNTESFIPRNVLPPQYPVNLDPPDHAKYRRLIMPHLMPKALKQAFADARETAIRIINELGPTGQCEFIGDFAAAMPHITFLSLVGQPVEHREFLRSLVVSPTDPRAAGNWVIRQNYVREVIADRRANPRDDIVSHIVRAEVDGKAVDDDTLAGIIILVLGGGVDTVASTMGFMAKFLADNPKHRRQLQDDPKLQQKAIEEFVRRYGISNLGRITARDTDHKGVTFRKGDMVIMPFPLYGLDERVTPDPLAVDFNRRAMHSGFGRGIHTCAGAVLARGELMIFLEEWLTRIPEFRVADEQRMHCRTGIINNVESLPLQWDPATFVRR